MRRGLVRAWPRRILSHSTTHHFRYSWVKNEINKNMGVGIQAILGGAFVGFILWLSQTRFGAMAGLLLFFPIISVPTFFSWEAVMGTKCDKRFYGVSGRSPYGYYLP